MSVRCLYSTCTWSAGLELSDHEPFIVRLAGDSDSEEFILTISEKQIIEKNIRGIITEMLDLSALIQLDSLEVVRQFTGIFS